MCIKYSVLDCTNNELKEHALAKIHILHYIGVFGLYIDGDQIYIDNIQVNFSFEQSLIEAVKDGTNNDEVIKFLLYIVPDFNYEDPSTGKSAFMIAAKQGCMFIVEHLMEANVDVNFQSKDGVTALIIASHNGHQGIVELLLKNKLILTLKMKMELQH